MAVMGDYCKAYYVKDLRAFDGWAEHVRQRTSALPQGEGEGAPSAELGDDDHLYVQENFAVTRGIFMDEDIVFDAVTESWKQFVRETLKFEPPVYETITLEPPENPETTS